MKPLKNKWHSGFTLAELLIALGILGVIAAFTIPKIMISQQSQQNNATAKEVASMISAAYSAYVSSGNTITTATTVGNLTPYMNYVTVTTSGNVDDVPTFNVNYDCSSGITCLKMHSGGILFYRNAGHYYGTGTTNAALIFFDPDGIRTGSAADGPGKAIVFVLYANGRLSNLKTVNSNTVDDTNNTYNPCPTCDPSWFSW